MKQTCDKCKGKFNTDQMDPIVSWRYNKKANRHLPHITFTLCESCYYTFIEMLEHNKIKPLGNQL